MYGISNMIHMVYLELISLVSYGSFRGMHLLCNCLLVPKTHKLIQNRMLSRLSVYIVFLYRYYKVFTAAVTLNEYTKKQQFIVFGIFASCIFIQTALLLIFPIFLAIGDIYSENAMRIYLNASWVIAAMDFILIGTAGYLLNRSILKIIIFQRAGNKR